MHDKEDREILEQFKNGLEKEKAFSRLMKKYQQKVYWHIRRIVLCHEDADDVTQKTFIRIWKNLGQFEGKSTLYTWIYRIATNESISHLNKIKQLNQVGLEDEAAHFLNRLQNDQYFTGDQIQLKLQEAILRLPEKQRIIFTLKYFEDHTFEELSDILETSVGALKASYHYAAEKIEKFLKQHI